MKRLVLILLTLMSVSAMAEHHLTEAQVLQRLGLQQRSLKSLRRAPAQTSKNDLYYVFNCEGGGYVIASADDRARAILGRCDQGEWNPGEMPPAMQGWLESMTEALQVLAADSTTPALGSALGDATAKPVARAASTRVEPLLGGIKWGQNTPFNNLCPAVGNTHSATGCAATAMAQIMRYHKWPEHGYGSNSYTSETIKFEVNEDFSTTTYDWANMLEQYFLTTDGRPNNYNETQANAVATLMYHLGAATDMDYNTGASGTTEGPMIRAMQQNFNYDKGLQIYYREYFTSPQWYALLQSEIDAKRPVLMNGYSISGGHAFVIDGYDTTMGQGYFHFNWGWNGMSDGYYSVDITDPGQQGTGGSLGGYSYNQNIFVGIQKPTSASSQAQPNLCVSAALRYQYGQLHYQVLNRGCGAFSGEVGYVIEDGATKTFKSVESYSGMQFRQGSGSKHVAIEAPTKAGLRYYLASRVGGTVKVLPTSVGSTAVLVSTMDRTSGTMTLVPEEAGLAKLQCTEFKLQDGVAYAGTTVYFTVKVTNTGSTEYNGALYLSITDIYEDGSEGYEDRATDNPLGVYVRPGETVTCQFPYYGTPAAGKYRGQLMYNPRNGGGLDYVAGSEMNFEVVPYKAPAAKNPPVLKVLSRELSATTVEQGKTLTLKVKVENTGGEDAVLSGGVIYQKRGNTPKGYLEQLVSFPKGESEWTFTSRVMVEPGDYRLLVGYEDAGFWEVADYNYLYFTVTEPTEPIDPDPIDPDPIDPDPTDPIDPDPTDPDPINPDGPTDAVVLQLDDVFANYYSSAKFSQPGHYYYFFNYGNLADENGFPWFLFNIYQTDNTGIQAGTYSRTEGTLGDVVILRSMDDYNSFKAGTPTIVLADGTITLTDNGDGRWNMKFSGTDTNGVGYVADATLPIALTTTADVNDPMKPGQGGGQDPIDPSFEQLVDVNYCEVQLWTNPNMSPEGYYDYYFQMAQLKEGNTRAERFPYIEFDVYLPVKGALQEGTYILGDKVDNLYLLQNTADERAWDNFEDNYGFQHGKVTLTNNGGDNWTIELKATAGDGTVYVGRVTTDITLKWCDEDPWQNPGVNDTFNKEPIDVTTHYVNFDLVEKRYLKEQQFYYINLESAEKNEKGEIYVSEFYFRTEDGTLPAGTYNFTYDDKSNLTFVSSHGDGMSGGRYPCYIGMYDGTRINDVWYLTQGSITISYGEDPDDVFLTGEVTSHFGSTFYFSSDPDHMVDGVGPVIGGATAKNGKVLDNGRIYINHGKHRYDLTGRRQVK